jgi:diguanylate cyclase (GGDEF)-like protein
MGKGKILLLNPDSGQTESLRGLCQETGPVLTAQSFDEATFLPPQTRVDLLIVDRSLADAARLQPLISPRTSVLITGPDEQAGRELAAAWPAEYFVDFALFPAAEAETARFLRSLRRAAEHARLKQEIEALTSQKASPEKIRAVYSEIKEIKNFINDNVVRELEKRVALQVRYLWFQRRKQKIEEILRKIYLANDVSSLLDTVADIKQLVQASGVTFYILDENETLGKYLKPLVWDDAFLSYPEFNRYVAVLDSPDFAAQVVRRREDLNLTNFSPDKGLAKRYVEHLKNPLRSLLGVPIMHEKEVIGVLEVYNKLHKGEPARHGFSLEDQQVLRGLSEHISMAMTKLNMIHYDALTGLLRPDPFFDKVIQKINQQSKRRRESGSYAVVMGDVDWFKNYNDRQGHEAGNKLLRQLASVLKSSIREEDFLCRYGGEEFLFFLTGVNSMEEACLLTDRIRKNVEDFYFEDEESQPQGNLTMSFGVTLLPSKDDYFQRINKYELKKLANEADTALAEAKGKRFYGRRGPGEDEKDLLKNRVCVFQRESAGRERRGALAAAPAEERIEERRKHDRHYISTLLLYQEDGHFKVTRTVNLSLGGARISSDTKLPQAGTLDLFLILENKATPFKGDVVYSQKSRPEAVHYHSGIQFREIGAAERQALENYLAAFAGKEVPV